MAHTKQLLSRDEMNSIEVVTNKSKVERYIGPGPVQKWGLFRGGGNKKKGKKRAAATQTLV